MNVRINVRLGLYNMTSVHVAYILLHLFRCASVPNLTADDILMSFGDRGKGTPSFFKISYHNNTNRLVDYDAAVRLVLNTAG